MANKNERFAFIENEWRAAAVFNLKEFVVEWRMSSIIFDASEQGFSFARFVDFFLDSREY